MPTLSDTAAGVQPVQIDQPASAVQSFHSDRSVSAVQNNESRPSNTVQTLLHESLKGDLRMYQEKEVDLMRMIDTSLPRWTHFQSRFRSFSVSTVWIPL
ncbi:MAG: hypothetical protein IPH85_09630 [Ignavibacteria bacterium]|nr:hypothetical protein [Ignavibacteria bacterium]